MLYLVFSLFVLAVIAMVAGYIRNRRMKKKLEKGEITDLPTLQQVEDMECCGQHEVCEKESLLAAVSRNVEYYDDEELDRFRGRLSTEYSEEEVEEFREILYSMQDYEVAGWVRSLQLRAVELPDSIIDEVFLIVGERRSDGHKRNE